MTEPDEPTAAEQLRAALDGERANADHLRALARRQSTTLDNLTRRTSVRLALSVSRRLTPARRAAVRWRAALRQRSERVALTTRSVRQPSSRRARRADLARALGALPPPPVPRAGRVSIVVLDDPQSSGHFSGPAPAVGGDVELVVVTGEGTPAPPGADRVVTTDPRTAAGALAQGAVAASGDYLCFASSTAAPLDPAWLVRLVASLGDGVAAATPLVIHPERPLHLATPHDLRTRERGLGIEVVDDVPVMRALGAGEPPATDAPPADVDAASATALVVDRAAYDEVGGLDALDDVDAAIVDLCLRLRGAGHRIVVVPSAVVAEHRPIERVEDLAGPLPPRGAGWQAIVERHGPALVRAAGSLPPTRLRFALTVAAPSRRIADRWGDWHLAQALGRSLQRLGHEIRLQTADEANALAGRSCDVHVVLRGLHAVRRTPGQRHVLWIISHPETVAVAECNAADLVLVASPRFAAELAERTSTPVEVLLQATDHHRFRPTDPSPAHRHDVTVVAKTREVLRPLVADALAAGLRPAIYGTGWDDFIDEDLIVSGYVPNERLPTVYSSAGVLLNDHWDTMRAWGFVSNRLFDALACGTPVISDDLPEIAELFGDTVLTYDHPRRLRQLVDSCLADPDAARVRAARGRATVVAHHTFDHRARELLGALARHGLTGGRASSSGAGPAAPRAAKRRRGGKPDEIGPLPNFLVIGAMKAGTTSLWHYLREHPEVFMTDVKEPHFFSDAELYDDGRGLPWYREQFVGADRALAIGEASTDYTKHPHEGVGTPERIARTIPDVRLVYVLRDPIERLRSHYVHVVHRWGERRPLAVAVREDRIYVDTSRYRMQIDRYLEHFDRSRLLVVTAEDLHDDPRATLARIYGFLEVDTAPARHQAPTELHRSAEKRLDTGLSTNLRRFPGYSSVRDAVPRPARLALARVTKRPIAAEVDTSLSEDLRAELLDELRPDVAALRELLPPGFDGWGIA